MPSARTTRTCATPFGTVETSSTLSGTADPSNLYLLRRLGEDQENRDNPSNRRREEVEPSRVSTERSTSSSADTDRRRTRDNKSSTIAKYWWRLPVLPPIPMVGAPDHLHSGRSVAQLRPPRQIPAPRRSGDPRGRGSSINVTFPRTLQGLGVHLKELHESDTPFFCIVPTEGEYPLGHIYMPVTFGTRRTTEPSS
jgi:hypothetical protein